MILRSQKESSRSSFFFWGGGRANRRKGFLKNSVSFPYWFSIEPFTTANMFSSEMC